ncbi:MAG: hypothetical protein GY868_20575 [Deltaproteobacteria bacterium]|nr:hypothetical protein [Deltaproteobacteria bacterium]
MRLQRSDMRVVISLLLLLVAALTGLTGYLQVRLDLHRFVPHKYLAYSTLLLIALHVGLNAGKMIGVVKKFRRG